MKIKILGSGSWEGIPAPFCNCRICKDAISNPNSKNFRFRPCFEVINENKNFLIEISPDIRLQLAKFNVKKTNLFLVSHWHFDHMYGLLELDAYAKFVEKPTIYCSKNTKEWLDKNFAHVKKDIIVVEPFKSFRLIGIKITPIPLYHMRKQDENLKEDELKNVFGFILESNEKRMAYLPCFFKLPEKSKESLRNLDTLITDGTFIFENLIPKTNPYEPIKSDPDHLHGNQIFELIKELNPKKAILYHISDLTENTHNELQKLLPKNIELSFDGMEIKG